MLALMRKCRFYPQNLLKKKKEEDKMAAGQEGELRFEFIYKEADKEIFSE